MKKDIKQAICPICEGKMIYKLSVPCDYRKPHLQQDYFIFWCSECDYGQLWNRPSKAEIASFYDIFSYYTHDAPDTVVNDKPVSFLDRLRTHISWRLDTGSAVTPYDTKPFLTGDNLSVCDIGCGLGEKLLKFRSEGFSVCGVEPDPIARKKATNSLGDIYDGTAEELPESITSNKYDAVLMMHALEHCLDINTAVLNAKSILKKGGIFIVETPNCQSLGFRAYKGEWPWSDIPRHLNFFTPSSLEKTLNKHGFNVVLKKYRGFCRQFSNSWLSIEEEIWLAFSNYSTKYTKRPNFKNRAWGRLLRSIYSSKASKYDSVRLIGSK